MNTIKIYSLYDPTEIIYEHRGANLEGANLEGANLEGANLECANLYDANLKDANLEGANLEGANLECANLYDANLKDASLYGANLECANLYDANLKDANLEGANLEGASLPHFQLPPEEGEFIAYKKLSAGVIAKIRVPANASRTSTLVGRKCRASHIEVVEFINASQSACIRGWRDASRPTFYEIGKTVYADSFDPDIRSECTHGIHFFMTKREAKDW